MTHRKDGLYGANAVVSRAPIPTARVEAFLQDILIAGEIHMRVGDPPED